ALSPKSSKAGTATSPPATLYLLTRVGKPSAFKRVQSYASSTLPSPRTPRHSASSECQDSPHMQDSRRSAVPGLVRPSLSPRPVVPLDRPLGSWRAWLVRVWLGSSAGQSRLSTSSN